MSDRVDQEHRADPPRHSLQNVTEAVTLLRTVQQHHVQLSAMADQKAGFLIGGSVVLLGLVLGQLDEPSVALVIAGSTAITTLALSIIAVMPRFYTEPIGHARPNLMFFGVFSHIPEDDFIDQAMELLDTEDGTRRAFLRDIHQMGVGLNATKFRYLAYAFRIALGGMAAAFVAGFFELVV